MFSKSDKNKKPKPGVVDTLIGNGTEIRGDVLFSGGLHNDGVIKGKVLSNLGERAALSISEIGAIEGDVSVPDITVNGAISGNVYSSERLVLASQARVKGNVYYNRLEIQPGAAVNGQMVHDPSGDAAPSALRDTDGDSAPTLPRELRESRPVKAASGPAHPPSGAAAANPSAPTPGNAHGSPRTSD